MVRGRSGYIPERQSPIPGRGSTDSSTITWIVVAVIVVLAVAALLAAMMRKKKTEQRRTRAEELRRDAVSNVDSIRQTDVGAKEAEARAERARLEAERAEAEAVEAQRAVDMERATYEDRLREADRLDPEVDHRSTERTYDPDFTGSGDADGQSDQPPDQPASGQSTVDNTSERRT